MRDSRDLFMRLCGFFARLGFTIADAKIHTTRNGYALDSFVLLDPGQGDPLPRSHQPARTRPGRAPQERRPADRSAGGRPAREVKHFPITPTVSIRPRRRGQHFIMSVTAADRPGLLFGIAETLVHHGINLHTAKIATLGARIEDTFPDQRPGLSARIHRSGADRTELLEKLAI